MCASSPSVHLTAGRSDSYLPAIVNAIFLVWSDLSVACTADDGMCLMPLSSRNCWNTDTLSGWLL